MIEEIKLVDNPSKKYASLELEKELYLVTHPENWETEALQIQPNSEEQINFSIALENLDQTTNKPSNPGNAEDILKNTPNMKQSDFTIELGRRKETSL
ncbi:MAG: hypothetical protein LBD11_06105 [Candidatus Peribacteria bacterium]|jgi:hypothetical protein|nr:hypothetical protein [Candidatus Peribacteria bacterium]